MSAINFENGTNTAPGLVGATYNEQLAKAQVCMAHLPESAYVAEVDYSTGRERIRSFKLCLSIEDVRAALEQISDRAAELAEQNKVEAAEHAVYVAERAAEMREALDAARAAIEPARKVHAAFEAALKALRPIDAELAQLATSKPDRIGLAASLKELRRVLTDELKRLEGEQAADEAKVMEILRRKGFAA